MSALLQPGFDTVVRSALLGLQFRDAVDGRVVADGLRVELQDRYRPQSPRLLAANRSGVFVLHEWPGMPGFGAALIGSPAEPGRFRLTAHDATRRYLPVAVAPEVPSSGLWSPPGRQVPDRPPHVPLFSAASRPAPAAMGCLRAELRRSAQPDRPAAWARLELRLGSTRLAEGLADEAGRAMLVFPLPRPREATLRTSPAGTPTAFEWPVTLHAFWRAGLAEPALPDLTELLAQPAARLLRAIAPELPLPALTLVAGETLQAAGRPLSSSPFVYVAE